MRERDIVYQNGSAWVKADHKTTYEGWEGTKKGTYVVMVDGLTHATSDSAYALDPDGLSIAKARCDYLAKRERARATPLPFDKY